MKLKTGRSLRLVRPDVELLHIRDKSKIIEEGIKQSKYVFVLLTKSFTDPKIRMSMLKEWGIDQCFLDKTIEAAMLAEKAIPLFPIWKREALKIPGYTIPCGLNNIKGIRIHDLVKGCDNLAGINPRNVSEDQIDDHTLSAVTMLLCGTEGREGQFQEEHRLDIQIPEVELIPKKRGGQCGYLPKATINETQVKQESAAELTQSGEISTGDLNFPSQNSMGTQTGQEVEDESVEQASDSYLYNSSGSHTEYISPINADPPPMPSPMPTLDIGLTSDPPAM